ncbi:MAG TPA: hypothetical protein VKM94_15390 [Blastocatellia bacterium]|nr:hypothetical protein [Blastocatellia bacterium]
MQTRTRAQRREFPGWAAALAEPEREPVALVTHAGELVALAQHALDVSYAEPTWYFCLTV